jgi:polygalacturonase
VLSDAAERSPDTPRLQTAIDSCAPGKAVELKPSGANDIFLSGPRLNSGVTLLVGAGTALFASRDPRDYEVQPGSCGIVGTRGPAANRSPPPTTRPAAASWAMAPSTAVAAPS